MKSYLLFAALIVSLAYYTNRNAAGVFGYGAPGTTDFIEYWSAYRLLESGDNPYIALNQQAIQSQIGRIGDPMMMWNPPWLTVIMSPVLCMSFTNAARTWMFLSLVGYFISLLLVHISLRREDMKSNLGISCFFASFIPLLQLISVGQVASIFAISIALCTLLITKGRFFLAGAMLSLSTAKPHLFYLPGIGLAMWSIRNKQPSLLLGIIFGCGGLAMASEVLWPNSLRWWIDFAVSSKAPNGVTDPRSWAGSNLVGLLRATFSEEPQAYWAYQSRWIVPGITGITFAVLFIFNRIRTDILSWLTWIVPLSLITSPFGWMFDQVAAAPCLLALMLRAPALRSESTVSWLMVTINLVTIFYLNSRLVYQHQYTWYLPLILLIIGITYFTKKNQLKEIKDSVNEAPTS